jgi:hypothetical protein
MNLEGQDDVLIVADAMRAMCFVLMCYAGAPGRFSL